MTLLTEFHEMGWREQPFLRQTAGLFTEVRHLVNAHWHDIAIFRDRADFKFFKPRHS